MKRGVEIAKKAVEEFPDSVECRVAYALGAKYADEHPANPWRDAKKDPPKDGEYGLFHFTYESFMHGEYEARKIPNRMIMDAIGNGYIDKWMLISEIKKGA